MTRYLPSLQTTVDQTTDTDLAAARKVVAVSADGTLVAWQHALASAAAGVRTLALPTGQPNGTIISVEKSESSTNPVLVTGNIRGVAAQTSRLLWQYDRVTFAADAAGSWWAVESHRPPSLFSRNLATPPNLVVQGTWSFVNYGGLHSMVGYNPTSTLNDGAGWYVDLHPGTWTLYLFYNSRNDAAITTIDISYDGGTTWTSVGTVDMYVASGTGTRSAALTGIVVTTARPLLRFRGLSKNASSSSYIQILNGIEFLRTA